MKTGRTIRETCFVVGPISNSCSLQPAVCRLRQDARGGGWLVGEVAEQDSGKRISCNEKIGKKLSEPFGPFVGGRGWCGGQQ